MTGQPQIQVISLIAGFGGRDDDPDRRREFPHNRSVVHIGQAIAPSVFVDLTTLLRSRQRTPRVLPRTSA
ncbi:MAG: hypothetical protein IPO51_15900 [Dehalococcoidia bacterium]|nr:hypothetical protein [Dehalococcoidia bacterium]